MKFKNANDAFCYYYYHIISHGVKYQNTIALFNQGFYITNPMDNIITANWRNWKSSYAKLEWEWYLSKEQSVEEIKKHAKIWDKMHAGDNIVNSNYGYQWSRNNQIDYVINELKQCPDSRKAFISIYDGKEHEKYKFDTPCTIGIQFYIQDNKLCMTVIMRSNDLWFGFCNDQYCFSKLLELVAAELNLEIGTYYHFVNNLHLYEDKLKKHFL